MLRLGRSNRGRQRRRGEILRRHTPDARPLAPRSARSAPPICAPSCSASDPTTAPFKVLRASRPTSLDVLLRAHSMVRDVACIATLPWWIDPPHGQARTSGVPSAMATPPARRGARTAGRSFTPAAGPRRRAARRSGARSRPPARRRSLACRSDRSRSSASSSFLLSALWA